MTIATAADGVRTLELEQLQVSPTGSQAERRKHFDKAAIAELAESIKEVGLLSPIIARPVNGHFEVVAGERRFIAAQKAGLTAISVSVRTLSDEQVLEIQLVENLQREGLHELAEAEGYETLMKSHGYSAEQLADKVGKSRAYIYARLKLTALGADARKAFYDGKLNASTALLVARIPDAGLQKKAAAEIIRGYGGEPMSYREAAAHMVRQYMLRLEDAPFETADAQLLPKAGACGPCPKRTGNQPGLFGDVKGPDVCTDPTCFESKRQAFAKLQRADAESKGIEVISGDAAKKLAPYGAHSTIQGHVRLDQSCTQDPKYRTYKQLLGKDVDFKLLQDPNTGAMVKIVSQAAAKKALKESGVIKPASSKSPIREKTKDEDALREQLYVAINAKSPMKLTRAVLVKLVEHEFDIVGAPPDLMAKVWGEDIDRKSIANSTEAMLCKLLFELTMIFGDFATPSIERLTKMAKDMGIDIKAVRKVAAQSSEAKKPVKGKKK